MMIKQKDRCGWCLKDQMYINYHDLEWGLPTFDDQVLFEFLILEGAQAGLSWHTILKRRKGYQKAFSDFDPQKVARYSEKKIQKLLKDAGIIRNQLKIRASVKNAQIFLRIQEEFGSFSNYQWQFVSGKPIQNKWKELGQVPATSKESDLMSKDMKSKGFQFVGSTILYAHMQAVGMVNDHLISCFRHKEVSSRFDP